MINFLSDILKLTGLPAESMLSSYRYVVIGGNICYVEKHNGVFSFDTGQIVLNLKGAKLYITGTDLHIKHLSRDDIVVHGRIREVMSDK